MRIRNRCISLALGALLATAGFAPAQVPSLRIVVIEGEGAVNIIQQKTATAPVVEVRDRNNLPVPGVIVAFTVGGGKSATFAGGAQTLTVTTNLAGRAAASALTPLSGGPMQIQVTATFQGQSAAAVISQTNVMTAAQAAAAADSATKSASGSSGSGSTSATPSSGSIAGLVGGVGLAVAGGVAGLGGKAIDPGAATARRSTPALTWMITTFRNGSSITPCQSPATSCELRLSDNNGASQIHLAMTGISAAENTLVLECIGFQVGSSGSSRDSYQFANTFPGAGSGPITMGYVPGLRYSTTGVFPFQATWTAGGSTVLSLTILITVVP